MDTRLRMLYLTFHETTRQSPEPGEASPPGGSPPEGGHAVSRRGDSRWCIAELGGTLAAIIPKRGQARTSPKALSWSNTVAERAPKGALGPASVAGPLGSWVYDQPLDLATHQRAHWPRVWHCIHHTKRLEAYACLGLELPETRQTSPGAERKGDPLLEVSDMAPHKKKPQNLEPIWASLTRVASCSCRLFPARGLRKGRPPYSSRQVHGPKSQPSLPSRFPQNANALVCIVDFIPTRIFAPSRLFSSLRTFSATCGGTLFSSGTVAYHTEPNASRTFSRGIPGSTSISCLRMHPNLIPTNLYGDISSMLWRTVSPTMSENFTGNSNVHYDDCNDRNDFSDPAFMPQSCRGQKTYPLIS